MTARRTTDHVDQVPHYYPTRAHARARSLTRVCVSPLFSLSFIESRWSAGPWAVWMRKSWAAIVGPRLCEVDRKVAHHQMLWCQL